jgi:peptidyl-prolyl cis-trans isomerase D
MLEQMRRSSQSLLIYVLFGIVIAVFIINFGPQSGGACDGGPGQGVRASTAAQVEGRTIGGRDFRYAYLMAMYLMRSDGSRASRIKEQVMDALIERELMAQEAERVGLRVGEDEIIDMLTDGKIVFLGGRELKLPLFEKNGAFDPETFERFVQYQLQMTPASFYEQQRKELLASRMRGILRGGVNVASGEVKAEFERSNNQVNLEYVRFPWRGREAELEVSEADVAAYVKANEKKLKELYDQRKVTYENLPKERRLRQILVKVDTKATPEQIKAAEKKADALAARIKKGESFAAVAKDASEDARTKARGGDLGWRRQSSTGLGAPVEEKVWPAADGEVVGPIKGDAGFSIVKVEATREGTQAFEKVQNELAESALREEKAKAKAKADAEEALAKATANNAKTLKDLFPVPPDALAGGAQVARAEETGLFSRRGNVVEGIGPSAELAKAAFALTTDKALGGPFEVSSAYYIVRLKERKHADAAEFEKKKGELTEQATLQRGAEVVNEWAHRRCVEAKEQKKIQVNLDVLRYDDNPETRVAYEPCSPPIRL